ncbi:expressed protein [Chlorella variabilis]|uniref:Expressed protein n=1 Tax=Chlorella variabilis TaxID=554065 RepID=E1ZF74_CHLVA|nr:expressed protein [Chlorella variabilis]EFN55450.1 expressed protein [Chlorella variabilis]|eukprot:XP_005847552.1 expressed protein [Chlorella variabilis]
MRGKYMTADSVRNAVRSAGARDYLDQTAAEAGKKSKYKGIWYYQTGRAIQKDWMPRPEWSAVVVAPPAAAGKAPPKMIDIYRVGEPPFFAIHAFESEVEAALAYDYATLWLLLRSKGCTDSKLRNHRWNLPQLKLWQRPAVKWLAACGLEEVNAVQKYVRNKASKRELPAASGQPGCAARCRNCWSEGCSPRSGPRASSGSRRGYRSGAAS